MRFLTPRCAGYRNDNMKKDQFLRSLETSKSKIPYTPPFLEAGDGMTSLRKITSCEVGRLRRARNSCWPISPIRVGVKNWSALNEPLFSKYMKLFPRATQDGNRNGNKKEKHFLRFGRLRRAGRSKVLDTSRLRCDTRTDMDFAPS